MGSRPFGATNSVFPKHLIVRGITLRCHQTWRAGKWTIEIGDFPKKKRTPHETSGFPVFPSLRRLMKPEG